MFERTQGQPCDPKTNQMSGCDFIDVSHCLRAQIFFTFLQFCMKHTADLKLRRGLVDGFTLPFKLEVVSGTCTGRVRLSSCGQVVRFSLKVQQCAAIAILKQHKNGTAAFA